MRKLIFQPTIATEKTDPFPLKPWSDGPLSFQQGAAYIQIKPQADTFVFAVPNYKHLLRLPCIQFVMQVQHWPTSVTSAQHMPIIVYKIWYVDVNTYICILCRNGYLWNILNLLRMAIAMMCWMLEPSNMEGRISWKTHHHQRFVLNVLWEHWISLQHIIDHMDIVDGDNVYVRMT